MSAVIVGARHRISPGQWERFARTGTSHLMAVSGLHIGLAGGSASLVGWLLAALLPGRRNLRDVALSTGVACAAAYAMLSGFAVPARRALLMAFIGAMAVLRRRRVPPADILALTALIVVLASPGALLTPGFRLSFAAVTVLLLVALRHVATAAGPGQLRATFSRSLKQLATLQFSLLAGLFSLVIAEFGRFSPVAPLINIVVLPVFNLLAVPLALAGALLDGPFAGAGDRLLVLSKLSLDIALSLIDAAGARPLPATEDILPASLPALLLPLVVILFPVGWPGRAVGLIAIVATVLNRPVPPPPGCVDYHTLDVGQGLAVVVQTHRHSVLFDTGPSFRGGGSAARVAVLPFLRRMGINALSELIVSHADLDHAGGLRDVMSGSRVGLVRVGEPLASLGLAQEPCVAGDRWRWDGVDFTILHPRSNAPWHGNNASCVMEISAGSHRLLLTGDIEAPVETLLAHRGELRAADVVFVPHHGSRTSSTEALIRTTSPALAIVSAGFRNRWGQPAPDVTARWERAGATVLNTADTGAISQRVCADTGPQPPRLARRVNRRVWHAGVDR
jgi:competence protein ComEC